MLDLQSPRPLLASSWPLVGLVDEDRELSPGWHTLTAFRWTTEPAQTRSLTIGQTAFALDVASGSQPIAQTPAEPDAAARCVLVAPQAALPPEEPDPLVFGLARPGDVGVVEYFLVGSRESELRLPLGTPARLRGLAPGDHTIGARFWDPSGRPLATVTRSITKNAAGREPRGATP